MVTHKEFIQAYSNKTDAEIRKCVVCGETNSPFINSSNMLDVIFHCHEHWLEKEGKKSPSSINRSLSDEIWGFKHHCFAYSSTAGLFQQLLSVMQDI